MAVATSSFLKNLLKFGMNRDIRRAQEKSERRQEKEGTFKRRGSNKTPPKSSSSTRMASPGSRRGRLPNNRFTGILAFVTALFILLQAISQSFVQQGNQQLVIMDYIFQALAYLLFAYFLRLWLIRRNVSRSLLITAISSSILLAASEFAKMFNALSLQPFLLVLAVLGTGIGSYLAEVVYRYSNENNPPSSEA